MLPKGLISLIEALRALKVQQQDDQTNIKNVSKILVNWIKNPVWLEEEYYQVDPIVGFSSWLIHEENDHTLAVNLVAWQLGREIVPHDHKTWAVVGSVVGTEKNYFWQRVDDGSRAGYVDIKRKDKPIICSAGDIVSFLPDDIHSVINEAKTVAISLHVYGKNLNYTNRFQYDPVNKTQKPFKVDFR